MSRRALHSAEALALKARLFKRPVNTAQAKIAKSLFNTVNRRSAHSTAVVAKQALPSIAWLRAILS